MEIKPLQQADFETGMEFEQQLAIARAQFEAANAGYQMFMGILRKRYDAPAETYQLRDWAEGFISVEGNDVNLSND